MNFRHKTKSSLPCTAEELCLTYTSSTIRRHLEKVPSHIYTHAWRKSYPFQWVQTCWLPADGNLRGEGRESREFPAGLFLFGADTTSTWLPPSVGADMTPEVSFLSLFLWVGGGVRWFDWAVRGRWISVFERFEYGLLGVWIIDCGGGVRSP